MQVNEDVYGAKDTWVKLTVSSALNPPKLSSFGVGDSIQSAYYGYTSGKLPFNVPFDKSVCFIGVDNGFAGINTRYVLNNSDMLTNMKILETEKPTVTPLFFTGGAIDNRLSFYDNNRRRETGWAYNMLDNTSTINDYNPDKNLTFFTYIPVKDTLLTIVVNACTMPENNFDGYVNVSSYRTDLYTYINGIISSGVNSGRHIYEVYPVIIYIGYFALYTLTELSSTGDKRILNSNAPRPTIVNPIQDFQYSDEITMKILRYNQPNRIESNDQFSNFANPYANNPNDIKSGSLITSAVSLLWGQRDLYGGNVFNKGTSYQGVIGDGTIKPYYNSSGQTTTGQFIHYKTIEEFGGIESFEKYAKSQCAYLGMFFTDSYQRALKCELDESHVYLGVIDNDGITHGEYTEGVENRTQKQWEWEDLSENNYNPEKKPDEPEFERPSSPYSYNTKTNMGFECGKYYALNASEIKALTTWSNTVVNPTGPFAPSGENPKAGEYSNEDLAYNLRKMFNGEYPDNQIISLLYFPFDVPTIAGILGTNEQISIGNVMTYGLENWFGSTLIEVTARKLYGGSNLVTISTEDYYIQPYYNDFRDYNPYTTLTVSVAYHGTIDIDPSVWIGHYLSSDMIIDLISGSSMTVLKRDGIPYDIINGQVGVPVQFIARNATEYVNTLIEGYQNRSQLKKEIIAQRTGLYLSALTSAVASVASGNVLPAVMGIGTAVNSAAGLAAMRERNKNIAFTIDTSKPLQTIVSSHSPDTGLITAPELRVIRTYPRTSEGYNSTVYGRTVGFACLMTAALSTFTGFTQTTNVDLSGISATDTEKQMILTLLQAGVIL